MLVIRAWKGPCIHACQMPIILGLSCLTCCCGGCQNEHLVHCPLTLASLHTACALVQCDLLTLGRCEALVFAAISTVLGVLLSVSTNCAARGGVHRHLGLQAMVWLLQHLLRGNSCSPAIKSGHGTRRTDSARTSYFIHPRACLVAALSQ